MNLPRDVMMLLDTSLLGVQRSLGNNLVGMYLRGSLALGDFIPATSDVDVFVVTERPIDAGEFAALAALHADLATAPNTFAQRLEITYLDRINVRSFHRGQRHPTLAQGEALAWSEHSANWIVERWTVREHGIVVHGPDPKLLIDPISPDDLRNATRIRLNDWAEWANQPDDPDWLLPLSHKAYVVETMCRTLYTLASGRIASKPQAVRWARATLPASWCSLVERSQAWREDATYGLSVVPEVRRFVLWTARTGAANDTSASRDAR